MSINDKPSNKHNTRKEIASELGWSTGKTAQAEQVWDKADDEDGKPTWRLARCRN
ncbi:MAG: hypothetical protein WEC12_05855 [Balneolaceae bacterium]